MNKKDIMTNYQPNKTNISPSEHWNQFRNAFIDQIIMALGLLVVVGLPVSLFRSFTSGWQPLYTIHIILAIIIVCFYPFRKKVSFYAKSAFAIVVFGVLTLSAFLTFGLAGNGAAWFTFLSFLVAAIYSPRTTTIVAIVALLILGAIGVGIITGSIKPQIDANDYIIQPSTWVSVWVVTGVLLLTTVRSMGILQQSTCNLLQEIEKQHEQIIHLANHDQLTGLPLMRLARDRLEVASHYAERNNKKIAILFIDLDDFKKINDTYGHASGDYVLQQTAYRIRQTIRAEDTTARISGDEFLVLLGGVTKPQAAAKIARKLVMELSQPIIQGDNSMSVGASIGISLFPDDAHDFDTLKRLADEAMYQVKKSGKNNFTLYQAVVPPEHRPTPPALDPASAPLQPS